MNEGVAANHQFQDGSFPLHIAADHQDFEILKFLLMFRASPDFKNRHGQTPLMLGITQGSRSVEIVQALVNNGCRVNMFDTQRRTALHLAGSKALVAVMEILLTAGARVNSQDVWGRTPLHVTLLNLSHRQQGNSSYLEAVELLLCSGADPNMGDKKNATPLFLTVSAGDHCVDIFKLLLTHGAHPDKRSKHRITPFMVGVMKGHTLMCRLLIEQNCDPNSYNSVKRQSCFYQAIQKGKLEIAKSIVEGGLDLFNESWIYNGGSSRIVEPNSEIDKWLKQLTSQPQSLIHLCRNCIRKSIGVFIERKLKEINYPEVLKQYILLK